MHFALLLIFLFEEIIGSEVSEMEYIYVDKNMSWIEARNFCKEEFGARLSTLDQTNVGAFQQSCLNDDFQDMWTNTFISFTPFLTVVGCFDIPDKMSSLSLNSPSIYECQLHCSNYSRFAIKMNKCLCLKGNEIDGKQKPASLCNISCEEGTFCGGIDDWNVYAVVEGESVHRIDPLTLENTSCLTQQCINNSYLFRERNCLDVKVSDVSCDGFFSCTFEPGEPCFLIQNKNDTFDWIVATSVNNSRPDKAYEGAYFAYVEDDKYSPNQTAFLTSSIINPGYTCNWCLRFRYFIRSYNPTPLKIVVYKGKKTIVDQFTLSQTEDEWRYKTKELNIITKEHFKIFFETSKQKEWNSTIAIDDVTMIMGKCNESLTKLLNMKGNLQCTFEKNKDTCFIQDQSDDFDWTIQKERTKSDNTGPVNSTEGKYYSYIEASNKGPGEEAVLISNFELIDVSVNISMQYHMYGQYIGRLRLYLKNDNNTEMTLLNVSGDQGNLWKSYINITEVTTKSKVYIEAIRGRGALSDIAIDDIRFRITDDHSIRNWKSASQKCIGIMETYPVAINRIKNSTCWRNGPEQWIGVIKARKMYSGKDDQGRNPTSVGLLRTTNNITTTIWEELELNNLRSFACESERLNSTQKCKPRVKGITFDKFITDGSFETLMIPVLIGSLFFIIAIIVGISVLYKRKKDSEKHRNISSVELSTLANTSKHQETLSAGKNTMSPKLLEEDYDHLHDVNNTMTSQKDGVYSHMSDNQYGVQEKELSADTYDYPASSENEYGASQHHKPNNIMTSTKDDLYNHMLDNQYGQIENASHDTYDHTMRLENEYGAQHSNQNLNDTYDRPVLNAVDNECS
ncbi:uncharacterized protein LOC134242413 [Saccostrea cucullata]|uniref:uncharacterized protein LOC134242413 n=1 Tax=Saccostrea cuccullata TaxID=36930 RepID=UPI002ED29294